MREAPLKIRWRLLAGALSLAAAIAVTLPAAASKADLGQRIADIWPNALSQMASATLPSDASLSDIWPNALILVNGASQDNQNSQGNQDNQGDQNEQ